jgi:peptide-methionine (R)-S-oxide reductase
MTRRQLLQALLAAPVPLLVTRLGWAASAGGKSSAEAIRQRWRDFLPAGFEAPSASARVEHSAEEWRALLQPAQYNVLREAGTERAFTSPLNEEKRAGVFTCAGCDLPLFTSEMKYDSGTGWPSFFTSIPDAFATESDWKLIVPRTEYHCARCAGHHGHVFDDGPPPTGQRWCNNGIALKFVPRGG